MRWRGTAFREHLVADLGRVRHTIHIKPLAFQFAGHWPLTSVWHPAWLNYVQLLLSGGELRLCIGISPPLSRARPCMETEPGLSARRTYYAFATGPLLQSRYRRPTFGAKLALALNRRHIACMGRHPPWRLRSEG